ncbi:MAG: hypothetical protein WKF75_02515 [Singulisphaera sp.]
MGRFHHRTVPGAGAVPFIRRSPMSALSLVAAQEQFTATLSAVEDAVKFAFRRRLRRQEYEEALAEARAAAWSAWLGLLRKGKDPVEVGVHGIANNAIRYVRNGRKVGNTTCGRGAMDVFHRKARRKDGFTLVSLDTGDEMDAGDSPAGSWRSGWPRTTGRAGGRGLLPNRLRGLAGGLAGPERRVAECWPRGTRGSSWPAWSASRRRGSASCGGAGGQLGGTPGADRRGAETDPACPRRCDEAARPAAASRSRPWRRRAQSGPMRRTDGRTRPEPAPPPPRAAAGPPPPGRGVFRRAEAAGLHRARHASTLRHVTADAWRGGRAVL